MQATCLLVHIQPCSAPGLGLGSAVGLRDGESLVLDGKDCLVRPSVVPWPFSCHMMSPYIISPAV